MDEVKKNFALQDILRTSISKNYVKLNGSQGLYWSIIKIWSFELENFDRIQYPMLQFAVCPLRIMKEPKYSFNL